MNLRITTVTITVLLAALSFIYVGASPPPLPGDPVPGVDVSIEQSPSGVIVSSTQTNSSGFFEFKNLPPGKYKLKYGALPGQTASNTSARASSNYNTAKSNTAGVAMGTASETWNVTIEINPDDVQPGNNPGILITIGPKGGKVAGIVTVPSGVMARNSQGLASGKRQHQPIVLAGSQEGQSRVKGEADQVMVGADVSIQSVDGTIRKTKSDAKGNYTFANVPPGDWKLYLGVPPPPPGAKASISSSHSNKKSPPLLVTGTTNHYKVNIEVDPSKTVTAPSQGTTITIGGSGPGEISGKVTKKAVQVTPRN